MLEYAFFENRFRDQFTDWLKLIDVEYQTADGELELLVLVDEDIDNEIEDKLEEQYDLIMEQQTISADENDDPETHINLVGVQYTDTDGCAHHVRLAPDIVNRITQSISHIELQEFVQTVADSVLNRDDRPLCKK
jgi:hypothetical protein